MRIIIRNKFIYIISFVLMLVFVSSGQADYLDAEGGASGNTADANTGDPDSWWTTNTIPTDTLWARRAYGNDDDGNLGTAFPADIFEATGSTQDHEDCIAIMTAISGLIPGDKYDVNIVYWSATSQNWAVRVGFSLDNMLYYDRLGQGGATAGTATGRTQSDRVELTGLIGRIQADVNGEIKVYIDDKPSDAPQGGWYDRTWYDGVMVTPAGLTASNLSPPDGAIGVDINTELSWMPGAKAHLHDVYFGTDEAVVEDADTYTPGIYRGQQEPNTYTPPETLQWGQTYYWRIDEVNDVNIWKGAVWSFTVSFGQAENEIITFNDNGGWCWFQDERLIVHNNKLIIGSVAESHGTDGASRDGNIEVTIYDLNALELEDRFVLHANLEGDDHDAPAFLVRRDERFIAMYSRHFDDFIRYRISTYPGDGTSWQSEQLIDRNIGVTYSNIFRLDAENDGYGRTYNFYRGEGWNPNYIFSDDDGDSWNYGGQLISFDGRPYVKYASNNYDKIHFITTEAHPRDYNNSIYHGYIKNGNIYKSDGTLIKSLASGPIIPTEATLVFAGDVNNVAWTTDIHLDENDYPYIGFSVQKNQSQYDLRYHYARWDGVQWHEHEMAYAGTALYSSERDYTGLIALEPRDPNTVYISTNAHPVTGEPLMSRADGDRHYEIFRGETDDYGGSWKWAPITMDSDCDNIRPVVPMWDGQHTVLLWMRGTYYSYTNYDTDIVGIIDPEPLFENLTCEQLISLGYRLDSDISGPAGDPDCYVNLYDMAAMADEWRLCGDLLLGDISGAAGSPDYCIDFYDLAAIAAEWLACNDPQEETGMCIMFE